MANWLKQAASDANNRVSSKRVAMLIATLSLAISLIILAAAAYIGRQVDVAMSGVAAALAGLGGYSYVNGLTAEKRTPP